MRNNGVALSFFGCFFCGLTVLNSSTILSNCSPANIAAYKSKILIWQKSIGNIDNKLQIKLKYLEKRERDWNHPLTSLLPKLTKGNSETMHLAEWILKECVLFPGKYCHMAWKWGCGGSWLFVFLSRPQTKRNIYFLFKWFDLHDVWPAKTRASIWQSVHTCSDRVQEGSSHLLKGSAAFGCQISLKVFVQEYLNFDHKNKNHCAYRMTQSSYSHHEKETQALKVL